MIDRIRQDIQARLDQLLAEADRLRQALSALGADNGSSRASARGRSSSARAGSGSARAAARKRAARSTQTRSRSSATTTKRASSGRASSGRAASGGTKSSVLKALGEADGKALTASEVASATGLGRASVSTTLSKLARSGEVEKADRGYRLATNGGSPASAGS
jgi:CRP-like cAMP-binding protein